MANDVAALAARPGSDRFAACRVLRQPVSGTVPRRRILHPDVIDRRGPLRLFEAADSHVDFRRACGIAVGERCAAAPAEGAVHTR